MSLNETLTSTDEQNASTLLPWQPFVDFPNLVDPHADQKDDEITFDFGSHAATHYLGHRPISLLQDHTRLALASSISNGV